MTLDLGQHQQDGLQWLFSLEIERDSGATPDDGDNDGDGGGIPIPFGGADGVIDEEDRVIDNPFSGEGDESGSEGSAFEVATEVEQRVRKTGVDREVRNRFEELKTRDVRVQDRTGARLDMRNTVRRIAGDTTVTDLYERYEQVDLGDRTVGVALDMSGSMDDDEIDAKTAVGALCEAAQSIGDTVVLVSFKKGSKTTVLTGPDEEWRWTDLEETSPGGGTPTSTGVEKTSSLMDRTMTDESILFVVTDGKPKSTEDSAAAVEAARDDGHGVVGVGFGDIDEENLQQIFGRDQYTRVELEKLADALVKRYRAEMDVPTHAV